MASVRINICLAEDLFQELAREVQPRKRSRFIAESIKQSLTRRKARQLAEEYQAAAEEIREIGRELDGVAGDGLD
jgi:metal-responsive CopG/Arc/MetJ family transcriptional regulator